MTPYAPVPYDRELAGVEKILIVEQSFPEEADTRKLATNGANLTSAASAAVPVAGLFVAAIAAGVEANIEANQRARIRATLAEQEFDGEAVFDAALEAALTDSGYELDSVSLDRKSPGDFVQLVSDAQADEKTAILDVAGAGYGYQLVGGSTQWRPYAAAQVRLSNPQDPENIHMDNRVMYNPVAQPDVIVTIAPDEKYAFNSIDDLEANPELAREGVTAALTETALAVSRLLQ